MDFIKRITFIFSAIILIAHLSACGGGAPGPKVLPEEEEEEEDQTAVIISSSPIVFEGVDGGSIPPTQSVSARLIGPIVTVYRFAESSNQSVVDAVVSGNGVAFNPVDPAILGEGQYSTTVRISVCYDSNCNSHVAGSPRNITVSYAVRYDANITDSDGDGVADANDLYPDDPAESADTDNDGIGNNADTDDDNDSVLDVDDAFPLDETESVDTDGDGVGNNADTNDDNDLHEDVDDPRPLDASAPGRIIQSAPGFAFAHTTNALVLVGENFSEEDTFFVNGIEANTVLWDSSTVEIRFVPNSVGTTTISIQYDGHPYTSSTAIDVSLPTYYPYSEISAGGPKNKGYFDHTSQTFYSPNPLLFQAEKYQFTVNGWDSVKTQLKDFSGVALAPDLATLWAVAGQNIIELDKNTLSVLGQWQISDQSQTPLDFRYTASDIELDYSNQAFITTQFNGLSGFPPVVQFNADKQSNRFGLGEELPHPTSFRLVHRNGSGTSVLLGDGGSVQAMQYNAITEVYENTPVDFNYSEGDINSTGSHSLISNHRLFDKNYVELAEVRTATAPGINNIAAAISPAGDFIVTANGNGDLYWYDTNNIADQMLLPSYTARVGVDTGFIRELVISPDGLTLFVQGVHKIVVVPMWQIFEDAIGDPALCPPAGCGIFQSAIGENIVSPPLPLDPGFEALESPLKHVSPTYTLAGESIELILTGENFTTTSVVKFNDRIVSARFVHTGEMRVDLPNDFISGDYTVTVDGLQNNAPVFRVLQPQSATPNFWSINASWWELIYNPIDHVLFGFDGASKTLHRINLNDNSVNSVQFPQFRDVTWCAEDNTLYAVTGTSIVSYNSQDLSFIETLSSGGGRNVECIAENNLVITQGGTQSNYYDIWDNDERVRLSSFDFAGHPSGFLYSGTVDGVSARGDLVIVGESGLSSIDYALFHPTLIGQSIIDMGNEDYIKSKWRADGTLGIVNNRDIYTGTMALLGSFDTGTSRSSVISPFANVVFREVDNNSVEKIIIDPKNVSDLTPESTYTISDDIGTAQRMAVTLDGKTVFVAGTNGIVSLSVD